MSTRRTAGDGSGRPADAGEGGGSAAEPARPCPHLGRADDPQTVYLHPNEGHRCHAVAPPDALAADVQAARCYGAYRDCPRFAAFVAAGGPVGAAPTGAAGPAATTPAPAAAPSPAPPAVGLRAWAARRTTEDWLALGGLVFVALALAYGSLRGGPGAAPLAGAERATLPPPEATVLAALDATATPTPPPPPTGTPRPTRPAEALLAATVAPPDPPEGGLVVALAPAERGVGTFGQAARVPAYGQRGLEVGWFEGQAFLGGLLVPLSRLPAGSTLASARLELAGLADDHLGEGGTWTVEMLAAAAAQGWSDLTHDGLAAAEAAGPSWTLRAEDLAVGRINVLPFDAAGLEALAARLPEGRVALRIRGPAGLDPGRSDLFVWDTGYGGGYGTRPVLRVGLVPPPPTPGPAPGEPTELPLVVWLGVPTPAPTATPLPASPPAELAGRVLFLSNRFGETRLMVVDPATGRVGQVTQPWTYEAARAADRAAAGRAVRVAEVPCGQGGGTIEDEDGRPVPNPDPARRCAQLVVAGEAAGGGEREVTEPGWVHYDPALSPDGQWLAYVSQLTGSDEIFRVRTDGTGNQRLTENEWAWDKHPSFSPDGARIVFWSNRDGRRQLWTMNADGSDPAPLAPSPFDDWDPVWVK